MAATLDAIKRDTRGKNEARRLRAGGRLPAVVYGGNEDRIGEPIAIDPKALLRILRSDSGANTLIGLTLDGTDARVMVKEYQIDPVTHHLLHADFYRVAMDRLLTVTVPILVHGEARGVKQQGAILDFVHREIEVESLPADIPEHIDIDVSELMLGQSIRVRDLPVSDKWRPVSEPELMLVHVIMPKVEEVAPAVEVAAAATATPAEPEVIKKGKVEKPDDEKEKK